MRARGLKQQVMHALNGRIESRPVRARGLKHDATATLEADLKSRPVRARGLKLLRLRLFAQ